tara:strand:+ start:327 stop:482 length:156 start_codon:yes stop_codon:yes gene_type:complete
MGKYQMVLLQYIMDISKEKAFRTLEIIQKHGVIVTLMIPMIVIEMGVVESK